MLSMMGKLVDGGEVSEVKSDTLEVNNKSFHYSKSI